MSQNVDYRKSILLSIDFIIMILLIAIDQLTKWLVLNHLKDREPISLISGVLELDYLENRGSAFGMLQNQKVFIIFVGVVFMAVVFYMLFKLPAKKKFILSHILFSMIIAGGIGNMVDRFRFGFVVDFISFVLIHFPIFNFADICVCIAVGGLFILFLFVYKEQDLEFLKFKPSRYREIK